MVKLSNIIFIGLILCLPIVAQAQLKSDFVGICGFENFVNTSGANYRGDIVNFIDRYNLSVSTKNIQVGDQIIDGSGDAFEVTTLHGTPSNFEADITVTSLVSGSGAPAGTGQVYRVTANGIIPPGSVDNLGLSNVTKGLIDMHNALKLDSLLGTQANGDSIVLVDFALDSLQITMESGTVFKTLIPVDSLQQLQADSIAALYDSVQVKVDTLIAGGNINITEINGQYTISAPDPNVGTDDQTAGEVWYNDSYLPLNVNDVQQAIDSLKRDVDAVTAGASDGVSTAGALDVANEEIDVTVAAPGTSFSIDISGIESLNSFAGWDMSTLDDFDGAWNSLTGVPAGFADNTDNVDDADADITNEGQLSVGAGTGTTATINSNTSGSNAITIEASTGIGITENTGTNTIFIENNGDPSSLNELQTINVDFTGDFLTFSLSDGNTQNDGMRTGFGVDGRGSQNFPLIADTTELATVWALGDSLANIPGNIGWLKDSIAVGDVDIPMNRNKLAFSSNIPFGVSSDTLISISTPRTDGSLIPHFLVFNFGNQSAGFKEQDSNIRFFNTVNNEGLAYADDYFGAVAVVDLKDRQIPDIATVNRMITAGGGGGSAFWEDASGVVRTVSSSSGLDFVFGSTSTEDIGSAGDSRMFYDGAKSAFYAGEWTGTQANDVFRGFNSTNLSRNTRTAGYASASIGGEGNNVQGAATVAVGCDDCISDSGAQNAILIGQDARATLINEVVQGGGGDLQLGHHQYRRLIAWKDHSNVGTAALHLNGTSTDLVIPNNTVWGGQCECTAIVKTAGTGTSVGDHKFYQGRFAIKNISGSTSVQFIDTTDGLLDSPSFTSSSFSLLADNTNNALTILINNIPGSATSLTHITCTVHITETGY